MLAEIVNIYCKVCCLDLQQHLNNMCDVTLYIFALYKSKTKLTKRK